MIYYISIFFNASMDVFLDSAPFMILGFFMAGLLKAFVPDEWIYTHLNGKGFWPVIKASAVGVPIPLCSCGVIPAAAGLKEKGADKGAVAAFMISTPETGIDSISVTWALLDPFMTVIRPVGAFVTAALTGFLISMNEKDPEEKPEMLNKIEPGLMPISGCSGGCCCSATIKPEKEGLVYRLKNGMSFAFVDLIDDIGLWFIAGVAISGLISTFLNPEIIDSYIGKGMPEMVLMLCLSIPLYVCATASTPIAAALMAKGISPGAALVFLLAGPATNAATVIVTTKILGKKNAFIYVLAIALCAIGLGYATNIFYSIYGPGELSSVIHKNENQAYGLVHYFSAFIVGGLILMGIIRKFINNQCFSFQ